MTGYCGEAYSAAGGNRLRCPERFAARRSRGWLDAAAAAELKAWASEERAVSCAKAVDAAPETASSTGSGAPASAGAGDAGAEALALWWSRAM